MLQSFNLINKILHLNSTESHIFCYILLVNVPMKNKATEMLSCQNYGEITMTFFKLDGLGV